MKRGKNTERIFRKINYLSLGIIVVLILFAAFVIAPALTEVYSAATSGFFNQTNATNLGISLIFNGTGYTFTNGNYSSFVFYNSTSTYWGINLTTSTKNFTNGTITNPSANITLYTRLANSYNISDTSLQALWGLNNDSSIGENATFFVDGTGKNNGTCAGAACPTWGLENGTVSGGLSFDGGDWINITNFNASFPESNNIREFSTCVWLNIGSGNSNNGVITSGPVNNAQGAWDVHIESTNTLYFYIRKNLQRSPSTSIASYLNTWHYYCFVYDTIADGGSGVSIYIDGLQAKTAAVNTAGVDNLSLASDGMLGIGVYYGPTYGFKGAIDEVRIYNRSLSASEVRDLYELGSYHINWNNWTNEGFVTTDVMRNSTNGGKFMQFKAFFQTNESDHSPYLLTDNVSALGVIVDINATLISPANNTYTNVTSQNFTANMSSSLGISNATLYIYNQSGLFNSTFMSYIAGTLTSTLGIVVTLIDNVYTWFYKIYDNGGNVFTTQNNTIIIDTQSSTINLINPANSTTGIDNYPTFIYNVTDINNVTNATFYIDDVLNQTIIPIKNIKNYFYGIYLNNGSHNWSIATRDNSNNYNIQTALFTVGTTPCPTCQAYQEINGSLVVYANETIVIKTC